MTLLSLFPSHRHLLARYEDLRERSTIQQDEIRHLKHKLDESASDRDAAVARAERAWERIANWLAARSGLGAISMQEDELPPVPQPDTEPIEQQKPLARNEVDVMNAQFEKDMSESYADWKQPQEGRPTNGQ